VAIANSGLIEKMGDMKEENNIDKKIEEKYLLYFWQVDSVRPLY
jgi:hypothetical protein